MITLTLYFKDDKNQVSAVNVENVTYHEYFCHTGELFYVVDGRQKFRAVGLAGFVANPVIPVTPRVFEEADND